MVSFSAIHIQDSHKLSLLKVPAIQVEDGEVVAVTGPSGAGKSLYLQALFGWVDPSMSIASLSPLRGAALMIQDPAHGLTPGLSIGNHFREIAGKDWPRLVAPLSAALGLDFASLAKREPSSCSGGECQRIMLALVLLRNPRVLVCDEPVASLDPENEIQLLTLLVEQCRLRSMSLVFVTHRFDLIARVANRVLVIESGQMTFWGSKERLFTQPNTAFQNQAVGIYRRLEATQTEQVPAPNSFVDSLLTISQMHLHLGQTRLFEGFSWELDRASWWWLAGPSGSGKTSLMRTLAGLLPWQQGAITFGGTSLRPNLLQRPIAQRTAIQYVFQHGRSALNPSLPMDRQLRIAWQSDPKALARFAEQLSLDPQAWGRLPDQFSLGELQRLNLLKVLSVRPRLLLCDELLAPLDWVLRQELIDFLESYRYSDQGTIIVCAHDSWTRSMRPAPTQWLPRDLSGKSSLLNS